MTTDNTEIISAGIDAMLDGNRAKFADAVDAIMQDKVASIVDAMRDDLKTQVFNFSEPEGEDEEEEGGDDEGEETEEETAEPEEQVS